MAANFSPSSNVPIAPTCQWAANSHHLTWILLRQLQQNPSLRAVLWPITGDPPTFRAKRDASEELARKIFADEPLYQPHVAVDPSYYGKAAKGKIWMMRKRYEELKEKLKTASERVARGGDESNMEMKILCESIKEEYPYHTLLMAINGDPEIMLMSGPGLEREPRLASPGSLGTLAACSARSLGVAAPKVASAELAAKRTPGNGEEPMDELTRDKRKIIEEVENGGRSTRYSIHDFREYSDDDSIMKEYMYVTDDEGEENQKGMQNRVRHKGYTDVELASEEPEVVSSTNSPKIVSLPPSGGCNALKAPSSSSASNKRARGHNDSDESDADNSLGEYLTKLGGLRYKAASNLHREKMRRKQDRFNAKTQEHRAQREHERYMIDAKIRLAQIKYSPARSCAGEEQ